MTCILKSLSQACGLSLSPSLPYFFSVPFFFQFSLFPIFSPYLISWWIFSCIFKSFLCSPFITSVSLSQRVSSSDGFVRGRLIRFSPLGPDVHRPRDRLPIVNRNYQNNSILVDIRPSRRQIAKERPPRNGENATVKKRAPIRGQNATGAKNFAMKREEWSHRQGFAFRHRRLRS